MVRRRLVKACSTLPNQVPGGARPNSQYTSGAPQFPSGMFPKPLEGASSVSTDGTLLAMTGDSLLTRTLDWVADPGFSRVRDLLSSSDAAFTNLEVSLPRRPISPGTAFHGTRVAASSRVLD